MKKKQKREKMVKVTMFNKRSTGTPHTSRVCLFLLDCFSIRARF